MIASVETCSPIIEDLLLAMVDEKEAVSLEANCLPGRVTWLFRVDVNDTGKIIGKGGSHLRALELILRLMGEQAGQQWLAMPIDPTGIQRVRKPDVPLPPSHDFSNDLKLLGHLLVAVGVGANASQLGSLVDGYVFKLVPRSHQDEDGLLLKHTITFKKFGEQCTEELNLTGALGTLFRSIGRRQGVRYRIACGD